MSDEKVITQAETAGSEIVGSKNVGNEITESEIMESELREKRGEETTSRAQADKGVAREEEPTSLDSGVESQNNYPKGIRFIILTLALMATVFVAGLDQNILGSWSPSSQASKIDIDINFFTHKQRLFPKSPPNLTASMTLPSTNRLTV